MSSTLNSIKTTPSKNVSYMDGTAVPVVPAEEAATTVCAIIQDDLEDIGVRMLIEPGDESQLDEEHLPYASFRYISDGTTVPGDEAYRGKVGAVVNDLLRPYGTMLRFYYWAPNESEILRVFKAPYAFFCERDDTDAEL